MTDKKIVLSTVGSRDEAQKMAQALVERGLAACVNVAGPIESVYRWQGKVERATEFLLFIKTTTGRCAEVQAVIRELHSYELPECIEVAIEGGSSEYLDWIAGSVR